MFFWNTIIAFWRMISKNMNQQVKSITNGLHYLTQHGIPWETLSKNEKTNPLI